MCFVIIYFHIIFIFFSSLVHPIFRWDEMFPSFATSLHPSSQPKLGVPCKWTCWTIGRTDHESCPASWPRLSPDFYGGTLEIISRCTLVSISAWLVGPGLYKETLDSLQILKQPIIIQLRHGCLCSDIFSALTFENILLEVLERMSNKKEKWLRHIQKTLGQIDFC